MARPYEKLPPGAKSHLQATAAAGLLSESAAATALGMPLDQFRKVIQEHAPSREIWENCLAIERDNILAALYDKAVSGDAGAARTLLAIRHNLSEKQPQGAQQGVQVVFNLPAAMSMEDYKKAVQGAVVKEIGHE
jgi:hypothetical protein